ncbi:unnamed protein product [Urochloa humidicola]
MDHRLDQGKAPAGGCQRAPAPDENSSVLLTNDVLADILRRLPPRCIAVSRPAASAWRAAVDARCLMRADLLDPALAGQDLSTSTTTTSRSSSPARRPRRLMMAAPPSPASTTTCLSPDPVRGNWSEITAMASC